MKVVPYIGTWIETNPVSLSDTQATSYLIQVRGLKLLEPVDAKSAPLVVPYIGTWIETIVAGEDDPEKWSYLIQVRGLKLETDKTLGANAMSYLIQVRGLKLDSDNSSVISLQVVPYIGTWIETVKDRQDNAGKESRTLYRYVD